MCVLIPRMIAQFLHQPGGRIADVHRDALGRRLLRRLHRFAECDLRAIRFRRGCEIDHHFGERKIAFGRPEHMEGVAGRHRELQRFRVGQADVFRGHRQRAPEQDHRIAAAFDKARHPVERALGITAPQALVEGGEHVVRLLAPLVEFREAELQRFAGGALVDVPPGTNMFRRRLESRQRAPGVAVRFFGDEIQGRVVDVEMSLGQSAFRQREGALEESAKVSRRQRLEHEHPHA